MTKFRITIFLAVLFPLAASAQVVAEQGAAVFPRAVFTKEEVAYSRQDPKYFTINPASVNLILLGTTEAPDTSYVQMKEQPRDLNGILVSIDSIVNIAEKLWKIVEANKPVVGIDSKYAVAYPQGITSASQLNSWSRPKVSSYAFYAENLYGGVMINCRYKVAFSYNGRYKSTGRYLTAVAVIPEVAEVAWGYKFFMSAAVPDSTITNVGTSSAPVAAMQLKLSWKMSSVLKEMDGTSVYYIQGDGNIAEIASPWREHPTEFVEVKAANLDDLKAAAPLLEPEKVF